MKLALAEFPYDLSDDEDLAHAFIDAAGFDGDLAVNLRGLVDVASLSGSATWLAAAWETWADYTDDFIEVVDRLTDRSAIICECGTAVWEAYATDIGDRLICDTRCLPTYGSCGACSVWEKNDEMVVVHGTAYCDSCVDDKFARCDRCNDYESLGDLTWITDDVWYCDHCRSYYCSFCDHCDAWYRDEDSSDHAHGCECSAPLMAFRFPASGDSTIGNDERLAVELPKGVISEEGMEGIAAHLYHSVAKLSYAGATELVTEVGPNWQTKRGNFTKRLSSAFYKLTGEKLAPEVVSSVGNLARRHSSDASEWQVEFTRNLNLPRDHFANESSCWWTDYAESRCCLKSWGGMAIRTFAAESHVYPSGRAWVQPLDESLQPTHDTLGAAAFVVYNGYGDLDGYTPARIIAQLTGLSYKLVEFSAGEQYINNDAGYLVADPAVIADIDEVGYSYDRHDHRDAWSVRTATHDLAGATA